MKPSFMKVSVNTYGQSVLTQQQILTTYLCQIRLFLSSFPWECSQMYPETPNFGKIKVIKNHSLKFQSKLKNKETIVVFVGYVKDHSGDINRFFNMGTKRVVVSRDIIWLNNLYCHYNNSIKHN
jgi:hypothetical protein